MGEREKETPYYSFSLCLVVVVKWIGSRPNRRFVQKEKRIDYWEIELYDSFTY
jgi:hypothetical protein